ncbi:MAG: T9SS type A sorting domain-containing protein [Candidatus Krumholzibacteria bacterium]|nr:T9SS type A sorting domain-containing protein [Candidatus Krumholzibacteria bacterium]
MRCLAILLVGIICLSLSPTNLLTRPPDPPRTGFHAEAQRSEPLQALLLPDTLTLALYSFDDGLGGPDPQGWVSVDRTSQDAYFHVDDFSGAGGPHAPIDGTQSLWCGRETIPGCATCPGYGNMWLQYFESVAFPSSGDVTVDFLIEYDSEPGYDFTYIQYLSKSDVWQTLDSYDGKGAELASVVVPADSVDASVKLRFHFFSDGGYSDEDGLYVSDGAVVIDSVTVSDNTGVLDFQDFETEALGATTTTDGDWTATSYPAFGDHAGLFDGSTVLQEDSLIVNTTYLWGFFNGSTDNCDDWCGVVGSGNCHSHAPLIDNVRLLRTVVAPIPVTNTSDSGPGSLRQAIVDANAQPGLDEIRFDIPGPGPHVISLVTDLPALESVVMDATTQPGYSGSPLIVLDGGGPAAGRRGPWVDGNNSVVRGFEIRNFQFDGLLLSGISYTVVEKNNIHHNGLGINLEGSGSNNVIGGITPDLGNAITDNAADGIYKVHDSVGNSFLCNSIARNGDLGIDLQGLSLGVTPNDDQDPDMGPNGLQNFPTLRWAHSGLSTVGASLNSTPNNTFLVQFFSNPACDGSGHGEGQNYLGSTHVTTGPDGNIDFALTTLEPFADGEYITATDALGSTSEFSECLLVSTVTAVGDDAIVRPALYAAVPNPFNPSTVIRYDVRGRGANVRIVVYDVTGRRVATLVDGQQSAGEKRVSWDGRNDRGAEVASGVYFYRMTTGEFSLTRKMLLLK